MEEAHIDEPVNEIFISDDIYNLVLWNYLKKLIISLFYLLLFYLYIKIYKKVIYFYIKYYKKLAIS